MLNSSNNADERQDKSSYREGGSRVDGKPKKKKGEKKTQIVTEK